MFLGQEAEVRRTAGREGAAGVFLEELGMQPPCSRTLLAASAHWLLHPLTRPQCHVWHLSLTRTEEATSLSISFTSYPNPTILASLSPQSSKMVTDDPPPHAGLLDSRCCDELGTQPTQHLDLKGEKNKTKHRTHTGSVAFLWGLVESMEGPVCG